MWDVSEEPMEKSPVLFYHFHFTNGDGDEWDKEEQGNKKFPSSF